MTEIYTRAFALWLNVTKLMVCLRLKNKTWMIFRNYSWKDRICSTDTSIVNRWPGSYRSLLCIILKVELYMLTFWLVLTYNLLEDRHINDVINTLFVSLLHKTSRFHVALRLFGNRDVKRTSVTHSAVASCSTFLF